MSDARTTHVLPDELLDYFEERLADDGQRQIEEHLAVCDSCTVVARNVRALNEAWDWTAAAHGALAHRELLARSLEAAATESPGLRDRLRSWRQQWAGFAEAGLHIVVDASAAAAQVVAEGLDALARPGSAWQFAPAQQGHSARGDGKEESASALLTTAVDPKRPRARVAVRGGPSTEIEVRIDGLAPDARSPIVVLMSVNPDPVPLVRIAEAESRPGATYRIARFSGLEPGEYVVALEPLALQEA